MFPPVFVWLCPLLSFRSALPSFAENLETTTTACQEERREEPFLLFLLQPERKFPLLVVVDTSTKKRGRKKRKEKKDTKEEERSRLISKQGPKQPRTTEGVGGGEDQPVGGDLGFETMLPNVGTRDGSSASRLLSSGREGTADRLPEGRSRGGGRGRGRGRGSAKAKSSDISFLRDRSDRSTPTVPPTRIPKKYHVTAKSVAPPMDRSRAASADTKTRDNGALDAEYDDTEHLWITTMFPTKYPTSRHEVKQVEELMVRLLRENQVQQVDPLEAVKGAQEVGFGSRVLFA
jgi:hypothetical protein